MILAQRLLRAAPPLPSGVQIITNPSGSLVVPDGIYEVAAMIIGRGGSGRSTNFPFNHRPGGGAGKSSLDSIPVQPGHRLSIRTTNVSFGGEVLARYELYNLNANLAATIIQANSGGPGNPPNSNGISPSGQPGSNNNRGGSVGGAPNNVTDSTDGYGVVADEAGWGYAHANGYGRGAASVNAGGSTSGGGFACIIVWGPGKGFLASNGSYWPYL